MQGGWASGLYLIQQRVLPQTENHHEAPVSCSERCEEVLRVRIKIKEGKKEVKEGDRYVI